MGTWWVGFVVGAAWGLANVWCLKRAVQCLVAGKKGWRLGGWLSGFGLSLVGLGISRNG